MSIQHLDVGEDTLFSPTPHSFTEVIHPTGVHICGGPPQGYKGDLTLWLTSTILITKYGSTPQGYNLVDWWLDLGITCTPLQPHMGQPHRGMISVKFNLI